MPIAKKQFDFVIRGRMVALDTAGVQSLANLQPVIDGVVIDGVDYDLTTPSALTGAVGQQFRFNTLVADTKVPARTVALSTIMGNVEAMIGTLKNIT